MEQTLISWQDFEKVEIRVGTIIEAEPLENARKPAIKMRIDFGGLGIRKSSAQIAALYGCEELIGCQVLAVVNFPPKQIGKWMSECLVLGLPQADGSVVLIQPERNVADGLRLA